MELFCALNTCFRTEELGSATVIYFNKKNISDHFMRQLKYAGFVNILHRTRFINMDFEGIVRYGRPEYSYEFLHRKEGKLEIFEGKTLLFRGSLRIQNELLKKR